ncbi:hypothetical protein OEG86_05465 [Hoeflea alexandrii]|nr:hypothetical protein [Hoeflea alexandrii]MCY0151779.1 hypothetical protein [Hoeflea alexandrii]
MLDQLVAGIMVDEHDLEQVFGQTGLDTQFTQAQARAGADAGMLEHAAIAGHQIGGKHADRLVERKVPWLDRVDHADRLIADNSTLTLGAMGPLLVGQHLRPVLGGVIENGSTDLDLGVTILEQLAGLAGHQFGEFICIVTQLLRDPGEIRCPLLMREFAPFEKSLMGSLKTAGGFCLAHQLIGLDGLFCRGVDGCDC